MGASIVQDHASCKSAESSIHERLKEERQRLGLSQEKAASLCGAAKRTIAGWEKEVQIPAEKLALLMSAGFDAGYVLDGVRSGEDTRVKISPAERDWLWKFKAMSPETRERANLIVDALVQSDVGKGKSPTIRRRPESAVPSMRDPAKPRDKD